MLDRLSERTMHWVRMGLTAGWLLLIVSLFYDPISAALTDANNTLSPFRMKPSDCVVFQDQCLLPTPYPMGARIFWGMIVPSSIVILLVFGHELWRRICPLSFVSQLFRALGKQRRHQVTDPDTNRTRSQLVTIDPQSWLGRNQLYFQYGLLFLGLNIRLLFANSDRLALGIYLVCTLVAALVVGYLYGGKTWCQYFCPMAPVQLVYTGPRGLLDSEAHQSGTPITQSMCRTVDASQKEKSACVSCQSPCIDIDSERAYWDTLTRPDRKLLYYGYIGLVIGFFGYFSLYAGDPNFIRGAVWLETNQLSTLLGPGFYWQGQAIPIPKLLAVPLTLGGASLITYGLGRAIEAAYYRLAQTWQWRLTPSQIQHHLFTFCTFIAFNAIFFMGVRPSLGWLPPAVVSVLTWLLMIAVSVWWYRTLYRRDDRYRREAIANKLRRQLSKLPIDFSQYLDQRSLEDLQADEVYVLAKTLPAVSHSQRLELYKSMLQESIASGSVTSSKSLEVLRHLRQQLNVSDEEHFATLAALGLEDPDLLNPHKRLTQENQLRLQSYTQGLERLLISAVALEVPLRKALEQYEWEISALQREYQITSEEHQKALGELFRNDSLMVRSALGLLDQLRLLNTQEQAAVALSKSDAPLAALLRLGIQDKQVLVVKQLLGILEILGDQDQAQVIAKETSRLIFGIVGVVLRSPEGNWSERLSPQILETLYSVDTETRAQPEMSNEQVQRVLQELVYDLDPFVQGSSLMALQRLAPAQALLAAQQLLGSNRDQDSLVTEVATQLLDTKNVLRPSLIIQSDGLEKLFQQATVTIGRHQDNDWVIADPRVSRFQCQLHLHPDGLTLVNQGSPKGLWLGDRYPKDASPISLGKGGVLFVGGKQGIRLQVTWAQATGSEQQPTTLQKLLWLFQNKFFCCLEPAMLVNLAQSAQLRFYRQGEEVCQAGQLATALYTIVEGAVSTADGEGVLSAGETLGDLAVLTCSHHRLSYRVQSTQARVLMIPATALEKVLRQDNDLARNLLLSVSDRLQSLLVS